MLFSCLDHTRRIIHLVLMEDKMEKYDLKQCILWVYFVIDSYILRVVLVIIMEFHWFIGHVL